MEFFVAHEGQRLTVTTEGAVSGNGLIVKNSEGDIVALAEKELLTVISIRNFLEALPRTDLSLSLLQDVDGALNNIVDTMNLTLQRANDLRLDITVEDKTLLGKLDQYYTSIFSGLFSAPGEVLSQAFASLADELSDEMIASSNDNLAISALTVAEKFAYTLNGSVSSAIPAESVYNAKSLLGALFGDTSYNRGNALELTEFALLDQSFWGSWVISQYAKSYLNFAVEIIEGEQGDFIDDDIASKTSALSAAFSPLLGLGVSAANTLDNLLSAHLNLEKLTSSQEEWRQSLGELAEFLDLLKEGNFSSDTYRITVQSEIDNFVLEGSSQDDYLVLGEFHFPVAAGAGNDRIYVNADQAAVIGKQSIDGGSGLDVVIIDDEWFDENSLSEQKLDGSYIYTASPERMIETRNIEYLYFLNGEKPVPLFQASSLFAISEEGLFSVESASTKTLISDDLSGVNLTIDEEGNLASASGDFFAATNGGGFYFSDSSIRIKSYDLSGDRIVRNDLLVGDYSWNISPNSFDFVEGYGEASLVRGITMISMEYGLVYGRPWDEDRGYLETHTDTPVGTAAWSFGGYVDVDPVPSVLGLFPGGVVDSATFAGNLIALSNANLPDQESAQRLLLATVPPNPGNAYTHLSFLDESIDFQSIAFSNDGFLLAIGIDKSTNQSGLYILDSSVGTADFIGNVPSNIADFVYTGTLADLEQLVAGSLENVDAPKTVQIDGNAELGVIEFLGERGPSFVDGSKGNDTILDGLGNNQLNGKGAHDSITALSGSNKIDGGAGNDFLRGGFQSDTIDGGSGNDIIASDIENSVFSGSDILVGGIGDDVLMGGGGADVFEFRPGDGSDVIGGFSASNVFLDWSNGYTTEVYRPDFEVDLDLVRLIGFDENHSDNVLSFGQNTNDGALFQFDGVELLFFGVSLSQITNDHFEFV